MKEIKSFKFNTVILIGLLIMALGYIGYEKIFNENKITYSDFLKTSSKVDQNSSIIDKKIKEIDTKSSLIDEKS